MEELYRESELKNNNLTLHSDISAYYFTVPIFHTSFPIDQIFLLIKIWKNCTERVSKTNPSISAQSRQCTFIIYYQFSAYPIFPIYQNSFWILRGFILLKDYKVIFLFFLNIFFCIIKAPPNKQKTHHKHQTPHNNPKTTKQLYFDVSFHFQNSALQVPSTDPHLGDRQDRLHTAVRVPPWLQPPAVPGQHRSVLLRRRDRSHRAGHNESQHVQRPTELWTVQRQ